MLQEIKVFLLLFVHKKKFLHRYGFTGGGLEHLNNFGVSGPKICFQLGYECAHRPPLASGQFV